MYKILICDLLTRGVIGLSEKERSRPQDILVNVEMETDIRDAALSDSIEDCVDYSEMTKAIFLLVEKSERSTLEALTTDIANLCLSHPRVVSVTVRTEKTSAVRFVKSVGVEITRNK